MINVDNTIFFINVFAFVFLFSWFFSFSKVIKQGKNGNQKK